MKLGKLNELINQLLTRGILDERQPD